MTHPISIIGTSLAGSTTVREFRKLDATTLVLVIRLGNGDFYAKPSLSNAFAQGRALAQWVSTLAAKMVETLKSPYLPSRRSAVLTRKRAFSQPHKTSSTTANGCWPRERSRFGCRWRAMPPIRASPSTLWTTSPLFMAG